MIVTRRKQIAIGIACALPLIYAIVQMTQTNPYAPLSEQEVRQAEETVDRLLAAIQPVNLSTCCETEQPLLTLFTTMKPLARKQSLYRQTIRNWAQFQPYVVPILYTTDEQDVLAPLVQEALRYNWKVYRAPDIWDGLPVLKAMFSHAINCSNTPLYGYANGDILFTNNLIQTISFIHHSVNWTRYVVTGRRTNVNYTGVESFNTTDDVFQVAKKGKLFYPAAEDYFISRAHGYPWSTIPRFVIGRVAFDNWIVANGLIKRIPVIDTTETVLAVHLTDFEGREAGRYAINQTDLLRNSKLIPRSFGIQLGTTFCIPFITTWNNDTQQPEITTRKITDKYCKRGYKRYRLHTGN